MFWTIGIYDAILMPFDFTQCLTNDLIMLIEGWEFVELEIEYIYKNYNWLRPYQLSCSVIAVIPRSKSAEGLFDINRKIGNQFCRDRVKFTTILTCYSGCHKYIPFVTFVKTVVRFLHKQGYALKTPQPWPDKQGEQLRETFLQELKQLMAQPHVDIWFADEFGFEGDPRSRKLFLNYWQFCATAFIIKGSESPL